MTSPIPLPVERALAQLDVVLGAAEHAVGKLVYVRAGPREFSQFAYREDWLSDDQYFDISPDLFKTVGHQVRKAPTKDDSTFFLALADTEPDTWGRRIIARAHAKERQKQSARFELGADDARRTLTQVVSAVQRWRDIALSPEVGMVARELEPFVPAFEHAELERARELVA